MKAVGRIQIPGTLGYDLSFIRLIPTPTGRKIRFVTNRKITLRRSLRGYRSRRSFNLTAGEIDLNDQDKSKSTGVLYPACQFTDQQGRRVADRSEPECLAVEQHHRLEGHGGKLAPSGCGCCRSESKLDCQSGCSATSHDHVPGQICAKSTAAISPRHVSTTELSLRVRWTMKIQRQFGNLDCVVPVGLHRVAGLHHRAGAKEEQIRLR